MYVLTLQKNNGEETYLYREVDNKIQVFTFNTPNAAKVCLNLFQQYCLQKMVESGDPFAFGRVMTVCSSFDLIELPNMEAEKISFEEFMKEKGYEI